MENITISKEEYEKLKSRANANEELLIKLIRGLEDIRNGRIKKWKSSNQSYNSFGTLNSLSEKIISSA